MIPVADDPVEAVLTSPPYVPESVGDRTARKLVVKMEIVEHEAEIADGSTFLFWTFGGTVPGPFIRARLGDEIEFHLDRKSTRLNSSHVKISYAVFCLKKKTQIHII